MKKLSTMVILGISLAAVSAVATAQTLYWGQPQQWRQPQYMQPNAGATPVYPGRPPEYQPPPVQYYQPPVQRYYQPPVQREYQPPPQFVYPNADANMYPRYYQPPQQQPRYYQQPRTYNYR